MTQYLKQTDRVRSLVRGIEADLRSMEHSNEKTFPRVRSKLKKSLEELSTEITNLYAYLDDEEISEQEKDRRQLNIEEFEQAQRNYESKLTILESNPPGPSTDIADSGAIDALIQSHKSVHMREFESDQKTSELISEIDSEVDEPSVMQSIKSYVGEFNDLHLMLGLFTLFVLFIWFMNS